MKKKILYSIPFLYVLINNGKYKNVDINKMNNNLSIITHDIINISNNNDNTLKKTIDITKIICNKNSFNTFHNIFGYNVCNIFNKIISNINN
jgi:hypothetical protein